MQAILADRLEQVIHILEAHQVQRRMRLGQ